MTIAGSEESWPKQRGGHSVELKYRLKIEEFSVNITVFISG